MSIASELNNLEGNIEDSYDAVNDMGGIIPAQRNMDNLDQAIRTIPQSQGTTYTAGNGIDITNNVISIDDTVVAELSDIPTATSDLNNDSGFITASDYATNATGGTIKVTGAFGVDMSNSGELKGSVVSSANYSAMWNDAIVSKGTLENALSTKGYALSTDIPTNTSDLTNDGSDGTSTYVEASDLATVATSGSYTDLSDKPTIPEPMAVYVDASFATPSSITGVFSDSALTTPADPDDMADTISAGNTVVVVYDGGQSQELIELSSVNSNSRFPEVGQAFTSAISTNAVFSAPTVVTLLHDGTLDSWSVETAPVPTKTSDITNDGSDGTSTYVEADDLATVATSGSYNDLIDLPSDRLYRMLVPTGTEITSSKNLNTTEFLVVGRYYCSANNTVATLSNCPTTSAFMMDVFSPLSTTIDNETTSPWCYRLRMLTTYTGETYVQQCETTGTANVWTYHSWVRTDNIQADWNASSGLAHILNRPGIKNATAATHTDYNNNQDYLPNMRFLSFWNGAYNSSGNSNLSYLASNAVKTANINNSAVTTDKINGSAVTKAKMHGLPCPDYSTVITNWGTINSTSTKTMAADGYIVGKALVTGTDKQAYIEIGGKQVAGIPYNATSQINNLQVAFCVPVKSGTSVKFQCSGGTGGYFQGCNLVGWQM